MTITKVKLRNFMPAPSSIISKSIHIMLLAIVLGLGIAAKVPSSKCTCHEKKKPVKQSCPFGELRYLASSTLAPEVICLESAKLVEFETPQTRFDLTPFLNVKLDTEARAPPVCS